VVTVRFTDADPSPVDDQLSQHRVQGRDALAEQPLPFRPGLLVPAGLCLGPGELRGDLRRRKLSGVRAGHLCCRGRRSVPVRAPACV